MTHFALTPALARLLATKSLFRGRPADVTLSPCYGGRLVLAPDERLEGRPTITERILMRVRQSRF